MIIWEVRERAWQEKREGRGMRERRDQGGKRNGLEDGEKHSEENIVRG